MNTEWPTPYNPSEELKFTLTQTPLSHFQTNKWALNNKMNKSSKISFSISSAKIYWSQIINFLFDGIFSYSTYYHTFLYYIWECNYSLPLFPISSDNIHSSYLDSQWTSLYVLRPLNIDFPQYIISVVFLPSQEKAHFSFSLC